MQTGNVNHKLTNNRFRCHGYHLRGEYSCKRIITIIAHIISLSMVCVV